MLDGNQGRSCTREPWTCITYVLLLVPEYAMQYACIRPKMIRCLVMESMWIIIIIIIIRQSSSKAGAIVNHA